MTNLLLPEWESFRQGTLPPEVPESFVREAQFFFYAGANVMFALLMRLPERDVDQLLYKNELQHELLEFIK